MASKIQVKRSAVASKVPLTTDLDLGEFAINTYDGKVYIKKNDGSDAIVEVTPTGKVSVSGGTAAYIPVFSGTDSITSTAIWRTGESTIIDDSAPVLLVGYTNVSTGNCQVTIGAGRTGNGYALLDLVGDITYPSYGLRIIRANTGANAPSQLAHRGTGDFSLLAAEAASITFGTNNAERVRINSSGNVGIGTSSPNSALEANRAVTFSTIDTFGQFVVKAASGATGHLLNFGVDTTAGYSFIQSVNRGFNSTDLVLQRYGSNVGIGVSPSSKLDVNGDVRVGVQDTTARLYLGRGNGPGVINRGAGAQPLYIGESGDVANLYIRGTGRVGIGETSPDRKLHVTASGGEAGVAKFESAATNGAYLDFHNSDNSATSRFGVFSDGSVGFQYGTGTLPHVGVASDGNVSIGATTYEHQLTIRHGGSNAAFNIRPNAGVDDGLYLQSEGSAQAKLSGGGEYVNPNWRARATSASGVEFSSGETTFWNDNALTVGLTFTRTPSIFISSDNLVGVRTTSPQATLDVRGTLNVSDNATDLTNKVGRVGCINYNTAEEAVLGLDIRSISTANELYLGGGSSIYNAMDTIKMFIASTTNTVTGAERFRLDNTGCAIGAFGVAPLSTLHVGDYYSGDSHYITIGKGFDTHSGIQWARGTILDTKIYSDSNEHLIFSVDDTNTLGETDFIFQANGSEIVRIVEEGRIGIGTVNPLLAIDIVYSNGSQFRLANTDADVTLKNGYIQTRHYTNAEEDLCIIIASSDTSENRVNIGGGSGILNAASTIKFYTAATTTTLTGTERMRITSAGRVGIGTTSPSTTCHIAGASGVNLPLFVQSPTGQTNCFISFRDPGTTSDFYNRIGCEGDDLVLWTSGSESLRLYQSGNVRFYGNNIDIGGTASNQDTRIDFIESSGFGGFIEFDGSVNNRMVIGTQDTSVDYDSIYLARATGNITLQKPTTCSSTLGVTSTLSVGANIEMTGSAPSVRVGGSGVSTGECTLEVGIGRTGNGYSYIDLIGDATYTDYGFRMIRGNSGANTTSTIIHRGTGDFILQTTDNAAIKMRCNNAEVGTWNSSGLGIGSGVTAGGAVKLKVSDADGAIIRAEASSTSTTASPQFQILNQRSSIGVLGNIYGYWQSNPVCLIRYEAVQNATTKNYGKMGFFTANAGTNAERMYINYDGGVVIGTPTGGSKGAGTLNASAIYDDNIQVSDYVFDYYLDQKIQPEDVKQAEQFLEDTNITDLEYFSQFWKKAHRLPSMPSREEFEEKGISVGRLAQRLWETVELQAIHIDQLLKRIEKLEQTAQC